MSSLASLDTMARRAGAITNGFDVPAHYGSPAGELAVCLRAVGLGDRSDLGKLLLDGGPSAIAGVVRRMTASPVRKSMSCSSLITRHCCSSTVRTQRACGARSRRRAASSG